MKFKIKKSKGKDGKPRCSIVHIAEGYTIANIHPKGSGDKLNFGPHRKITDSDFKVMYARAKAIVDALNESESDV